MAADEEVIDVELFHSNLQRKTDESLKKKYKALKDEVKALDTKNNKLNHAADTLRRQVFDHEQRAHRIAQLLGFSDIETAEARITAHDPWIPGGSTEISNARTRILLLEDELAKHLLTNKEAQSALADFYEQLTTAQNEAVRLRAERDSARQEAEKQAEVALLCRTEMQKMVPEMQALIKERHNMHCDPALQTVEEKENLPNGPGEPGTIPLHDRINVISPTAVVSTSHIPPLASDAEHYKHKFELLDAQYTALLDSKNKLSNKYREDMKRWKEFKEWIVKEEPTYKGNRRLLRRRVLNKMGPRTDRKPDTEDDLAPTKQDGQAEDPDVTLLDPHDVAHNSENDVKTKAAAPPSSPPSRRTPPTSHLPSIPPQNTPFREESLTQQSSVPPASQHLPHTASPPIGKVDDKPLPPQSSLTEPSSVSPSSPVQQGMVSHPPTTRVKDEPEVIVIDSSPERVPKKEPTMSTGTKGRLRQQDISNKTRIKSLKSQIDTHTPKARSELPADRKRPRTALPTSEPPAHKSSFLPRNPDTGVERSGIRRTSTVLAMDTPPRRSAAIPRHHSSPPDSPHIRRVHESSAARKGKRKASEMEEEGSGNESDPFIAGPSRTRAKPVISRTGTLNKKPGKEYLDQYMPYKGRGRYSNVKATADKTVNGEFEIDPSKNGGVNYQFDAVVRDKAERKQLKAGDCECCRDYYDAVGPLPPRLQPPLWRSPSSSQSQQASRPCRYSNNSAAHSPPSTPSSEAQRKAITAHKNEISRHRHNWAPTGTPPDYWHIGFPDTQTVEDINRRADSMHAHKFQQIEAEANTKNGRYKKRQ